MPVVRARWQRGPAPCSASCLRAAQTRAAAEFQASLPMARPDPAAALHPGDYPGSGRHAPRFRLPCHPRWRPGPRKAARPLARAGAASASGGGPPAHTREPLRASRRRLAAPVAGRRPRTLQGAVPAQGRPPACARGRIRFNTPHPPTAPTSERSSEMRSEVVMMEVDAKPKNSDGSF